MLNRFKDAVSKSTSKSKGNTGVRPPPKPEKYCYSRPHFLGLNYDESLASRDFGDRPIMTPRDITQLPLSAGYAECINGGKSDFNEDQATATDLLLKSHLRTDIARSCLDINLLHSLPKSQTPSPGPGSPNFNCSKPGPGSPNFNCSKLNSPSNSPRRRHTIKQISVDPESSDDDSTEADHNQTKPQLISTALSSETELIDFVSSGSHKTDSAQSPASRKKLPAPKTLNIATPHNHVNHHEEMCISATYYGLFDGHAGHTVSLIASKLLHMLVKEKLELCMGVIQKILTVNHVHLGKGSTDMTVEQLVTGALEEAFIDMDDQLERERTTYLIKGGCTALVALLFHGKLYVANAGDSRAVLCQGDKVEAMSQDFTAETERSRLNYLGFCDPDLLHDEFSCYEFLHRVNKPDVGKHVICKKPGRTGWVLKMATEEDLRFPLIVGHGKRVMSTCYVPSQHIQDFLEAFYKKARVMGTIGVTRCLGDHDLYVFDSDICIKPFLSPKPEVKVLDLSEGDWTEEDVLIIGSDGLWDTVSNERAGEIVRNTLRQPYEQGNEKYTIAAQELIQEARGLFTGRGWRKKEDDGAASFDDITAFVVPLKQYIDKWRQENQS